MSEKRISFDFVFGGLMLAALVFCCFVVAGAVRSQQAGIDQDVATWAAGYGFVMSWSEFDNAVDMLEHIQNRSISIDGAGQQSQHADEVQRARMIRGIVGALRNFTRQDFGADVAAWRVWRQTNGS